MKSKNFRYEMELEYDWKYPRENTPTLTVEVFLLRKSRKKSISPEDAVAEITAFLTSEEQWCWISHEIGDGEVSLQADDVNGEDVPDEGAMEAIASFLKKHPDTRRFVVTGYMA